MQSVELELHWHQVNKYLLDAEARGVPKLVGLMIWVIKLRKIGFVGSSNVIELYERIKVVTYIDGQGDDSTCLHKRPT